MVWPSLSIGRPALAWAIRGLLRDLAHAGEDIMDTINAESAVGADQIDLKAIKGDSGSLWRCTEDCSAGIIESHLCDDRQITDVAAGNDSGPQFADIEKGFKGDQVGTAHRPGLRSARQRYRPFHQNRRRRPARQSGRSDRQSHRQRPGPLLPCAPARPRADSIHRPPHASP